MHPVVLERSMEEEEEVGRRRWGGGGVGREEEGEGEDLVEEPSARPSRDRSSPDLVEALVSQSSTSSLLAYDDLSPGSWATTGLHYSASSASDSPDIQEFNLTFLDRPASQ